MQTESQQCTRCTDRRAWKLLAEHVRRRLHAHLVYHHVGIWRCSQRPTATLQHIDSCSPADCIVVCCVLLSSACSLPLQHTLHQVTRAATTMTSPVTLASSCQLPLPASDSCSKHPCEINSKELTRSQCMRHDNSNVQIAPYQVTTEAACRFCSCTFTSHSVDTSPAGHRTLWLRCCLCC